MGLFTKRKVKSLEKKLAVVHKTMKTEEQNELNVKKAIAMHLKLAALYDKLYFNKKFPHAESYALENFRAAAVLGDPHSLYIVSKRLIERGKFWNAVAETLYACKAHAKYARDAFEEAFVYLKVAQEKDYPLAKRLQGLVFINGWGIEVNQDQGFKLIVESIEQENAWDKATQIFQELGLNKPEFFSAMMSMREKKGS